MEIDKAQLIQHLKKLPPLSAPMQQVLSLLNDSKSDWSSISKVMLKDPVLTGRVLQIANSSFYGLHRQVKDIEVACAMLGSETLRGLIYTLISLSQFRHGSSDSLLDYSLLWKHSLRVACLAKKIARKCGEHQTTAFTIGLFHSLDLILQDYFFKEGLAKKIEVYCIENSIPQGTQIYSSLDSKDWWLTAILLEHWQFPPAIVSVFRTDTSESKSHLQAILIASCLILKTLGTDNKIPDDTIKAVTDIFIQNDIKPVDITDTFTESEELYAEMSGWMFN